MATLTGVLALQGAFQAHGAALARLGADVREVRSARDLEGLAALCMPGGESTTMSLLLDTSGLRAAVRETLAPRSAGGRGLPALATCAGMILLAQRIEHDSGSRRVDSLGLLDATVSRNSFGRQVDSFEADVRIDWGALGLTPDEAAQPAAFHGVFIRAPRIASIGSSAAAAGWLGEETVAVRQENIIAASFHPELSGDDRLHRALLEIARTA